MKKALKRLALLIVGGLLFWGFCSDTVVFEWLQNQADYCHQKIIRRLLHSRVAALWTFDESNVTEWVSGKNSLNHGTTRTEGRFGRARLFHGTHSNCIQTELYWGQLGSEYTLSLWVNLAKGPETQDILYTEEPLAKSGIRLEQGEMVLWVPPHLALRYRFNKYNRFVHIAAVVDFKNKKACLYEDGGLKAESAVSEFDTVQRVIEFGKSLTARTHYVMQGSLDEVTFWSKTLSQKEVKKLSNAFFSSPLTLCPEYFLKWKGFLWVQTQLRFALKCLDFFNPLHHEQRIQGLPEFRLELSKKDLKYFNSAQNECAETGCVPPKTRQWRRIHVRFQGRLRAARMALCGSSAEFWENSKRSFVLELPKGSEIQGLRRLEFFPPSLCGWVAPLLLDRLAEKYKWPFIQSGVAPVFVNGAFQGLYHYQESVRDIEEHTPILDWKNEIQKLPLPMDWELGEFDRLADSLLPMYENDKLMAVSNREMRHQVAEERRALETLKTHSKTTESPSLAERAAAFLSPELLLGDNPCAEYLLRDLNLDVLAIPGLRIRWSSSDPHVLSDSGKVIRPPGTEDRAVCLTATIEEGAVHLEKPFPFRVMPRELKLPLLQLDVPDTVSNDTRTYCRATFFENRGKIQSDVFPAKIKFRGNTALTYPKKSYALRFHGKHDFFGLHPWTDFDLMSCYRNPSFIRNKLAYDVWRSFSREGAPRFTPEVRFVEVAINRKYQGIYEFSEKITAPLLGLKPFDSHDSQHSVIYKASGGGASFKNPCPEAYIQKEPDVDLKPDYLDPYFEFIHLCGSASSEEFRKNIERVVDVDNAIDFQIFINFTFNKDAVNHNLFIVRDAPPGSRFFIIPWDYDKCFGLNWDAWQVTHLFNALCSDLPGFRDRFRARYLELRRTALSEKAVFARIDAMDADLRQASGRDQERWHPNAEKDFIPYSKAVQELKEWISARLSFLDHKIGDNDF